MQFNTFPYLIFLAVAIVLYWCLPQRFRRLFVLAVSLVFYATWGIVFVAVPLVVSAFVFQIGRRLAASPSNAKHWLWLGIGGVLALLIFFKYRGFLLLNV